MRGNHLQRLAGAAALVLAAAPALGASRAAAQEVDATRLPCNFGAPIKSGDQKVRLAMIVGVSEYVFNRKLPGAVKDAGQMYGFLVNSPGKVFPKENVCVLTNGEATYKGFKDAFQKALIDRAQGAEEVLIFYAGHGSGLDDGPAGKDETDGKDETLFLHDSSPQEIPSEGRKYNQLRDDEFNGMLAALAAKAKGVALILDSCHSGSATRDAGDERARLVVSQSRNQTPAPTAAAGEDKASFSEFEPEALPNLVVLSAARDLELAKETSRGGKFSDAMFKVLGRPDAQKFNYDQLMDLIAAAMASATNRQNPVLSGDGSRPIFSSAIPYKPRYEWKVAPIPAAAPGVAPVVKIRGVPTIGMGLGAEFLILPGSMTQEEAKKLDIAKARMRAAQQLFFNEWRLEPVNAAQNVASILPGDWAQMVRPSDAARRLKLRLRPANEAGGIANPGAFAEMMRTPFSAELRVPGAVDAASLVTFEAPDYDFEISRNGAGALEISDRDGLLRNKLKPPVGNGEAERLELARHLSNQFQQMTLLADWKPSGGSLAPNTSLHVSLVPYTKGDRGGGDCGQTVVTRTDWPKAANTPQRIPVCAVYQIKVKLDLRSPISLRIGASALSADGSMFAYPRKQNPNNPSNPKDFSVVDQSGVELQPGDEKVLAGWLQADKNSLGKPEYIYVLGLPAVARGEDGGAGFEGGYTIPWHLLSTNKARTRDPTTKPKEVNEREYGTYTILRITTVEQ